MIRTDTSRVGSHGRAAPVLGLWQAYEGGHEDWR